MRYLIAILAWLLIFAYHPPVFADTANYIYDELGRLRVVIDEQGNAATYSYDAVGNLLSITRAGVEGPVAIIELDPWEGEAGKRVIIYGIGFSATPSQNQVSFNGISSLVATSTPNTIITSVPSGATTGPVTVATPSGSAGTTKNFIVTAPISITVTPSNTIVWPGYSYQFIANVTGTTETGLLWSVNDIQGGNSSVGTITDTGLYTALSSITNLSSVTIKARSVKDLSKWAEAKIYFLENKPPIISKAVSVEIASPAFASSGPFISSSLSVAIAESGAVDRGPFLANAVSVDVSPSLTEDRGPFLSSSVSISIAESSVIDSGPFISSSLSVSLSPIITSITPNTGIQGQSNLTLTITGKGFSGATGIIFNLDGVNDSNITVNSLSVNPEGTQATVVISIDSNAVVGSRVVTITTPNGSSPAYFMKGNIFNINSP